MKVIGNRKTALPFPLSYTSSWQRTNRTVQAMPYIIRKGIKIPPTVCKRLTLAMNYVGHGKVKPLFSIIQIKNRSKSKPKAMLLILLQREITK